MDTNNNSGMSSTWLLFFFFFIWIIFAGGNGFGGRGERGADALACGYVPNCQVEKQTIVNTATTQTLIQQEAEKTRSQATSLYIQDQAEKMFDAKLSALETSILNGQALAAKDARIASLEAHVYADAKFSTLERNQERIECEMLKQPKLFGQAFVTTGAPVPPLPASSCGGYNF